MSRLGLSAFLLKWIIYFPKDSKPIDVRPSRPLKMRSTAFNFYINILGLNVFGSHKIRQVSHFFIINICKLSTCKFFRTHGQSDFSKYLFNTKYAHLVMKYFIFKFSLPCHIHLLRNNFFFLCV